MGRLTTFIPTDCKFDRFADGVTVHFEGDFDEEKAREYIKQNYPGKEKYNLWTWTNSFYFRGMLNVGVANFYKQFCYEM